MTAQQVTVERIDSEMPTVKELQEKVGGYIEVVPLSDGSQMVVDEDGKMKRYPANLEATELMYRLGSHTDTIVGNVVVLSGNALLKD